MFHPLLSNCQLQGHANSRIEVSQILFIKKTNESRRTKVKLLISWSCIIMHGYVHVRPLTAKQRPVFTPSSTYCSNLNSGG